MTLADFLAEWRSPGDTLLVHTSGSTGKPKPLPVEKRRMEASARATCRFLGLTRADTALLCMPLDYIAGKMMVVRSLVSGMRLVSVEPGGHPLRDIEETPSFAAMVPLQVFNSMQSPDELRRLKAIRHLLVGGGAVDDGIAVRLRGFPNAVWSTYGMTETLSHIALRRLSGAGASEWYTPMDGVAVSLSAQGTLVVNAPAVCPEPLTTNDIAVLAPDGRRFRIRGRLDNVICSGGLKMQIEELEAALRPYLSAPFAIGKRPDPKFGEAAALLTESADTAAVMAVCRRILPKYQRPRSVITVPQIPRTATGKPARAEINRLAASLLSE